METIKKYPMSEKARRLASIHKDIERRFDLEFEMAIDALSQEEEGEN